MNSNILLKKAPKMPRLTAGTECINLLLKNVSKDMREPLTPMLFPLLVAHFSNAAFVYPDNTSKEMCGMMANLVADSGCNKGQLTQIVNAVCRKFVAHDETEIEKRAKWQKAVKSRGATQDRPPRPDVALRFPPADMTNAAFIQNAVGCEKAGGYTQYFNLPEIEMADRICGGHRAFSHTLRNIYDRQRAGALRATADGVTGNPVLRVNLTISATPFAARQFFKTDLWNGTFGRMVFSYKARTARDGRIPRQGCYDETFCNELDRYLQRIRDCQGRFTVKPLNALIDKLAREMAEAADLADDDILWDLSKRSLVSAWKAGCILYVLNDQEWTRPMGELVAWLVRHDLWSKIQLFADLLDSDKASLAPSGKCGPRNMLDQMPDQFTEMQLQALRQSMGKNAEGTKHQIHVWTNRRFITYDPITDLYTKSETYLKKSQKNK